MADLRDDILKEEEQYGGFNPGEPDDDSFSIQDKSYPGNIFLFLNPLKAEPEINEDEPAILYEDESIDSIDNNVEDETPEEELFEFEKKKLQKKDIDEVDDLEDPNFLGYIQGLASVSKMKIKQPSDNDISDEEIGSRPFDPIDKGNVETNVVITDLDLDKPSTTNFDEKIASATIPTPLITPNINVDNQVNQSTDANHKDDKKKRRFGIIPILAAVALLLIVASALFYFLPNKPFGIFSSEKSSSDSSMTSKINKDSSKIDSSSESRIKSGYNKDAIALAEKNETENKKQDSISKLLTAENAANTNKEFEKTTEKEPQSQPIQKQATKIVEKLTAENDKKSVEKIEKKSNSETVKTPKFSFKPNKKDAPKQDIAKTQVKEKQIESTDITRETAINETYIPKDEPGLYIVQIYSSPSKEDAQDWLDKLKRKSVPDAFISEQNVRDRTWYRVRFGNFRTREEAKNAALRYGFAQTWIDRVK
jgi:cell division protein FtsN